MSFDKSKAMRNAERFLAQGKIRSAITEYRQVVIHDPRDIGTLNMLGDLYVKNAEAKEAVTCYRTVAEHYSKQGFAQKAIAVYNKISKLQPNSAEVSEKLARLYKEKGSVAEARAHFLALADHHKSKGRNIEALAIWKEIALLDPNNTEIYLTLGLSYTEEKELNEAAAAYTEAGLRFTSKGMADDAIRAFSKALELTPSDPRALSGYVESMTAAGRDEEAVSELRAILEKDSHNREVLHILADCYLQTGRIAEAEETTVQLVELEPSSYPRLVQLARTYIDRNEIDSAARILTMSSEHLLIGGQSEELNILISGALEKDPKNLATLRILARYCSWHKDEKALRESLERLAKAAGDNASIDDEHFALSQLAMLVPHDLQVAERLKQIREENGFEDPEVEESLFDQKFFKPSPVVENGVETPVTVEVDAVHFNEQDGGFAIVGSDPGAVQAALPSTDGSNSDPVAIDDFAQYEAEPESEDERIKREADSIRFYIDNGYLELAEKAIAEISSNFGERKEVIELHEYLAEYMQLGAGAENLSQNGSPASANGSDISKGIGLHDLRNELGLEEADEQEDSDYDTHYHTAVAYQEMGLLEDAIKEFQEAVGLVNPNDGSRRFFQCANLLGHCFMEKGMPNLALTWYQRALETPALTDDEKQALWYELAAAYEADGDLENAGRYFEQVYAENINFRDVNQRVRNMAVPN